MIKTLLLTETIIKLKFLIDYMDFFIVTLIFN